MGTDVEYGMAGDKRENRRTGGRGNVFLQTKENDDYSVSDDLIRNAKRVAADVVRFSDR